MKIFVPIKFDKTVYEFNKNEILENLRNLNATGVALTLFEFFDTEKAVELLKEYKTFFEENGLEVSLWIGGSLLHFYYGKEADNFDGRTDVYGNVFKNRFCPYDDKFVNFFCNKLKQYLSSGIKTVFLDDDFRLNIWTGPAQCFCEKHMEKYREALGENVSREDFQNTILYGGANKYRDVWLKETKNTLVYFAKRIREAVDSVDKNIRVGICSSAEHFFVEDYSKEIVTALAGSNKSWVRLTGAPYWDNGQTLAQSIEVERCLYEKCKPYSDEMYAEGDTYPHHRQYCSSSTLTMFDLGIRAMLPDVNMLKYALCYFSSLSLEQGYVEASKENETLANTVSEIFKDTTPEGYRIIENFEKLKYENFSENYVEKTHLLFTHPSISVAERNSLPTKYNGDGPCIAIGANAYCLSENQLKNGVVLDYKAAKILTERGIDVGLDTNVITTDTSENIMDCLLNVPTRKFQYDKQTDEYMYLFDGSFEKVSVNKNADVLTEYVIVGIGSSNIQSKYPASYYYVNGKGYKFYVMLYDYEKNTNARSIVLNYVGQKYLVHTYEKMSGKPLSASLLKCPNVYLQACKKDNGMVIGVWNLSSDKLSNAEIMLDKKYTKANFVGCKGIINGNRVVIESLPAFTFCACEVSL